MKCDKNPVQTNSGEMNPSYFLPQPAQDDKNSNIVGGNDQSRKFSNYHTSVGNSKHECQI
jgi:hypothetical protein